MRQAWHSSESTWASSSEEGYKESIVESTVSLLHERLGLLIIPKPPIIIDQTTHTIPCPSNTTTPWATS